MNAIWIRAGLQELKRTFRQLLADGSESIIDDAIAELEDSKARFDERNRRSDDPQLVAEPWGYLIAPERPLLFRRSEAIGGINLWIDLYCAVLWEEEGAMPVRQDIHLRVWSDLDNDCTLRAEWDSQNIIERLTDPERPNARRVMLRCHFDLANQNPPQQGPKYHLQFGGGATAEEFCWMPRTINLPRFVFPPMDLILACQLVAANFYWDEYVGFRETPEWINVLRRSQKHLLEDYYKSCEAVLEQNDSLLDSLWNI